jgi:hypothetical protein
VQRWHDLFRPQLPVQHLVGDPSQRRDEGRQGKSRVHEPTEGIDRLAIDQKRGCHLDGAIAPRHKTPAAIAYWVRSRCRSMPMRRTRPRGC